MKTTYRIVRMYRDSDAKARTIKSGLTLAEARAHCQDPETSSSTCRGIGAKRRTVLMGPWFDGYEKEKKKAR